MDNGDDSDWRRNMHSGMVQLHDKVDAMRNELQTVMHKYEHSSDGSGGHPTSDMIYQLIEQQTRASAMDISDTASTVSMGSTGSEDERIKSDVFQTKCLAEAFQKMFITVVRNIPFDKIKDVVVRDQMVSIIESEQARTFHQSEDGMRYLVMTLMDKDYQTMMKFLHVIAQFDPRLEKSIMNIFRERYEQGKTREQCCTVCLIRKRVSIKHVCDHYFTKGLISNELQKDVTALTSAKAHMSLWQRLFDELSSERTEYVLGILKDAIQDGEGGESFHHADIVRCIDRDIDKGRSLKCRCETSRKLHNSSPTVFKGTKRRQPSNVVKNALKELLDQPRPSTSTISTGSDSSVQTNYQPVVSNMVRVFDAFK